MKTTIPRNCALVLLTASLACDLSTQSDPLPQAGESLRHLQVGQEWRYASWEKRRGEAVVFGGDTISVSVTAKEGQLVTFFEAPINDKAMATSDTATFQFLIQDSKLIQVGTNYSRIFGFVRNHNGTLLLSGPDSIAVVVEVDTSLFLLREQTGKSTFVGHSEYVEIFSRSYSDVTVYYDETPTYVDGFGHLALLSPDFGVVAMIYFGGRSRVEMFGYNLVR